MALVSKQNLCQTLYCHNTKQARALTSKQAGMESELRKQRSPYLEAISEVYTSAIYIPSLESPECHDDLE